MKSNVFICPPCGESVAQATKEGQNKNKALWPLLPRLTAVLPQSGKTNWITLLWHCVPLPPHRGEDEMAVPSLPQGREMSFGFTLIELLVVVLIIGILAAVAVPQYKKAVVKARTAEALAMLKTLAQAEDVYYLANNTGTAEISKLDVDIPATQVAQGHAKADINQPNTYMYSCNIEGSCIANACNPDMPLLQYTSRLKEIAEGGSDDRGFFWCVPHTWTAGCEAKNEIAEDICKSMNGGRETRDYKNGVTTYYRIN